LINIRQSDPFPPPKKEFFLKTIFNGVQKKLKLAHFITRERVDFFPSALRRLKRPVLKKRQKPA